MILWYLLHRRPAKAQASLRIHAVSPEPLLFAHMKYGSRRRVRSKIRHLAHWMAAHAHLKNEFTEDEKYHNLMRWFRSLLFHILTLVFQALKQVANMDITLFMNCQDKLSEMPLKSFYRYVLEPEMTFKADGSLTLGPSARFTDLPQKSLLTLGMQPPESWLVESVRTQYDLDNILLEEVQCKNKYRKTPIYSDTLKFAVITLKFEQHGFTVE